MQIGHSTFHDEDSQGRPTRAVWKLNANSIWGDLLGFEREEVEESKPGDVWYTDDNDTTHYAYEEFHVCQCNPGNYGCVVSKCKLCGCRTPGAGFDLGTGTSKPDYCSCTEFGCRVPSCPEPHSKNKRYSPCTYTPDTRNCTQEQIDNDECVWVTCGCQDGEGCKDNLYFE